MQTINFCFESTAISFCFKFSQIWGLFSLFESFGVIFCGPLGLFLGSRSGSKTFSEPTNVDYQFLFWKYSPIFLFFYSAKFWAFFCTFWALRGYFWGWGKVQKLFWDLLIQANNFYFGSIALSCFFKTFPGGWLAGWVVGKSDFNENPVVSLDLDLDFDLGFVNCQS